MTAFRDGGHHLLAATNQPDVLDKAPGGPTFRRRVVVNFQTRPQAQSTHVHKRSMPPQRAALESLRGDTGHGGRAEDLV